MSTPRCIRLAIRACRPVKISNPASRSSRRAFTTTQSFREDDKIDIKAGFPEVPTIAEKSRPEPTRDNTSDAPPMKPDFFADSHLGVHINLAPRPSKGKLAATGSLRDETPREASATAAFDEGRRLLVNRFPKRARTSQIRDLFADYDVEHIDNERSYAFVQLKSKEDAQKAISNLSGQQLPDYNPDGMGELWVQARMLRKNEDSSGPSVLQTAEIGSADDSPRLPRNVIAAYHKPLRVSSHLGVRVASLQLRSYSVRSLEFMCDFALRAAFFLGLPASGPIPLPKKIERWTMPRSNFVHKKSQENFERITRRRAIQIMDGDKEVVQIWLAYLRKHQFYGVGMKADVWEFEGMDVAGSMDRQFQEVEKELDEKLSMFGWNKQVGGDKSLAEQLRNMGPGQQTGVSMQHIREGSRSESRI